MSKMLYVLALALLVVYIQAARVVVGYADAPPDMAHINATGDVKVLKHLKEIKALVLNIPDHKVGELKKLKGIKYVEEDKIAKAFGFGDYADVQWNVKMINAHLVWDQYFVTIGDAAFGYGVTVAVLDTGIDYKHPQLSGKVVYCIYTVGTRLYKGTNLGNCADRNGHGTHVAGIIAASLDNVGVAGVAPKVKLIAVKVLSDSGSGYYSDIAEGIIEAVKAGAAILSMSLGGPSDSSVLRDASYWAYQQGAVQVAAAGNSGDGNPSTDNVSYPARYSWVIAVAAVDQNGAIPTWSSDGPEVDVAAPGVNILSTYPGGRYAYMSGTSMATPHVTGVVALIQAVRLAYGKRALTPDEVYQVLTTTARDIGPQGFDVFTGYGLVDAYAAVASALAR
ncbi:S8 family peptidase [Pyrobaculum sp.]|uniref:S8 family peptidase n=1 Tax=Pyrobaculum sp. TaxID=2004705 RepID=UPI003172D8F4